MQQTTGQTISRLAVLSVLVHNQVEENRLSGEARESAQKEIRAIMAGERGPETGKVQARLAERCKLGGALYQVDGVGIYGVN